MSQTVQHFATSLPRSVYRQFFIAARQFALSLWKGRTLKAQTSFELLPHQPLKHLLPTMFRGFITCLLLFVTHCGYTQNSELNSYNVIWNSQSKNAGESMPCGAGDIGLNVWVENGELLIYLAKSGTFDENNALLKQGRVRVKLSPNPFKGSLFRQELFLRDGSIRISGTNGKIKAEVKVYVDVNNPVVHVEVNCHQKMIAEAFYESWRYKDLQMKGKEYNATSWKFSPQGNIKTYKDSIAFNGNSVLFYHQNADTSVFDATVRQQGLESVKDQLYNPLKKLVFGGYMQGSNMKPAGTSIGKYQNTDYKAWKLVSAFPSRKHELKILLHAEQASLSQWREGFAQTTENRANAEKETHVKQNEIWWQNYWDRSFININPGKVNDSSAVWQVGRNYQLMRYMLGCNALSKWPTKFNGGLFTVDPFYTDTSLNFTPDFRSWGGGIHTAQNQRLVYFPMLKSGDAEMMKPQFDFYMRILKNAELRSKVYWNHNGACFTEQIENFGLPNPAEYWWERPAGYDKGMEYNPWLEYEWDTVLEFCLMMLETERYAGNDIKA